MHTTRLLVSGMVLVAAFTPAASAQGVARALPAPSYSQAGAASPAAGLRAKVSIRMEQARISDVLEAIARQASIEISMTNSVSRLPARVTLRVTGIPAADAFRRAIDGTLVRMSHSASGQIRF